MTEQIISNAFIELKNFAVKEKEHLSTYEWYHISNGKVPYFLRISSSPDSYIIIKQEAEAYYRLFKDPIKNSNIINALAPMLKYAYHLKSSEIEILQRYSGIPISSIWQRIKFEDDSLKVQFMIKIFKEAAKRLSKAQIVHGYLCPDNILFEDSTHLIRFQGCQSVKNIEEITLSTKYESVISNIYYSQSMGKGKLDLAQSITADIKALALSIYEIGLIASTSNGKLSLEDKIFQKTGKLKFPTIDEAKLLGYNDHVLNKVKSMDAIELKKVLVTIITSSDNMNYEDSIISVLPELVPSHISLATVKNINETVLPFKTVIKNVKSAKISKFDTFGVYLIEYPDPVKNPSFIIKTYKQHKQFETELKIYQKLAKIPNLRYFTKMMNGIETAPDENAIEYGGSNFQSRLRYASNNAMLLANLISITKCVMQDINIAKIFHSDIKPMNIALTDDWVPKIFDYDVTVTDLTPQDPNKGFDQLHTFILQGATVDYASPEILNCHLGTEKEVSINTFRADMYSLGKTIIRCLTRNYKEEDMLNTLYGLEGNDRRELLNKMKESLSNENLLKLEELSLYSEYDLSLIHI